MFILTGLSVFMAPILKVNMCNTHLFLIPRTLIDIECVKSRILYEIAVGFSSVLLTY